jgi:hypothetical protein
VSAEERAKEGRLASLFLMPLFEAPPPPPTARRLLARKVAE